MAKVRRKSEKGTFWGCFDFFFGVFMKNDKKCHSMDNAHCFTVFSFEEMILKLLKGCYYFE